MGEVWVHGFLMGEVPLHTELALRCLSASTGGHCRGPPLGHLQEYLAHTETPPPRALQKGYAQGFAVVLWGGAPSYERGAPVGP